MRGLELDERLGAAVHRAQSREAGAAGHRVEKGDTRGGSGEIDPAIDRQLRPDEVAPLVADGATNDVQPGPLDERIAVYAGGREQRLDLVTGEQAPPAESRDAHAAAGGTPGERTLRRHQRGTTLAYP